jgi:two-component system, cell cycle response regulator
MHKAGQPPAVQKEKAVEPRAQAVQGPGPHILVLDDEPHNLALKRGLFEPHGYRVDAVLTVAAALELLQSQVPDLIISDVGRDTGAGFAFITQVRADPRLQQVPFIFITSCCWSDAERERGLALGAQRFLLRPLDPALVLAEVQACLRQA